MTKYSQALEILQLSHNFTHKELKRNYRKLALKYHPDKCDEKSGAKFKILNDAYQLLSVKYEGTTYKETTPSCDDYYTENTTYETVLSNFMRYMDNTIDVITITKLLSVLTEKGQTYIMSFLDKCDSNTCISIYEIIMKNKDVFHISTQVMDNLETIVREKVDNSNIVLLHPSINDLFMANVFKLEYESDIFFVPLWHSELYYEGNNDIDGEKEVIVKCIPDLPDHITLDEDNNVHINLTYNTSFNKLLSEQTIIYTMGDMLRLEILVCNLYIRKQQTITFLNKGIPMIVPSDTYNITRKSNVYIHLELLFDNFNYVTTNIT
jgi:hypothetical protein